MKLRVGITCGDPNGVGYEVIIKTLMEPHMSDICTPVIYGSTRALSVHKKTIEDCNLSVNQINKAQDAQHNKVNLVNCVDDKIEVELGTVNQEGGRAAFASLKRACDDLKSGVIDVLVTAPINKDNIQSDEFAFHGHTEYLEANFAGEGELSLMMLVSDNLRMALVTNHTPIAQVAQKISGELIQRKLEVFNDSLKKDFGIRKPRIAVLALNPHAGDNGLLGREEQEIIAPAIKQACEGGIMAFGPYSADGFFGSNAFRKFDGVLAMYHDQGLIPFKAMDMDGGVNFTAGLPIVRTSPDHGTGYDIAGKNVASEQSFRSALYAAIDIYNRRKENIEISANPLKIKDKRINNRE